MSLSLYDLTVPTLLRALEQSVIILQQGEKWAEENKVDPKTLIQGKLASDMLPLTFQIQTISNVAKGVLFRIGGGEDVAMEDNETSFAELHERLSKTIALLQAAKKETFVAPDATVAMKLGSYPLTFNGLTYVQRFVLPNFFFHHSAAYMILRNAGVPLGKAVYLGGGTIQS